jgi:hypothetical protein
MQPLSATECISPAIARTRLILFSPFRAGRTWKLSATAYLCRIGTMYVPFPLIYLAFLPFVASAGRWAVTALIAAVLIGTAFFTWIFYLCSRLQFAFFDMMVNHEEFVAPAWRKYPSQPRPWTGLKFLLGLLITLPGILPMMAFFRHVFPLFRSLQPVAPGQPPSPELLQAMLGIYAAYGLFLLVFGTLFLVSSLLSDFIVPSLALEDCGLKEAFRRMGELIRREPGECALYTLLKVILAMAGYIGVMILWEIVFLLATALLGAAVMFVGYLLHLAGVPAVLLTSVGMFLLFVWSGVCSFYSLTLAIGTIFTFMDAFALYFLGGRYPMLGDLLDRSTPVPAATYGYYATQPSIPPPPIG